MNTAMDDREDTELLIKCLLVARDPAYRLGVGNVVSALLAGAQTNQLHAFTPVVLPGGLPPQSPRSPSPPLSPEAC